MGTRSRSTPAATRRTLARRRQHARVPRDVSVDQQTVGLCAQCMHARRLSSSRGSTFWLCGLSQRDPRFPKYPRLPVRACEGFTPDPEPPG